MSDAYSANWNSLQYLGRGEQFFTYGGFTRQISLGWTVAAQSKQELIPMYKKLNYLASTTAPDYSPQGYMRGNIVQLTVGGYVYEQPGIITSLTYDIQDDSPWEIGIDTDGNIDNSVKQMPHIIRVSSFNFIPIQNFIPSKQSLTFSSRNTEDVNVEDFSSKLDIDKLWNARPWIDLSDDYYVDIDDPNWVKECYFDGYDSKIWTDDYFKL